jgi:hypothetical protein
MVTGPMNMSLATKQEYLFNTRGCYQRAASERTTRKKLPNGKREWILTGEENSHYVVEKKNPPNDWMPLMVLFNETVTVTLVDPDQSNSSVRFYRARLLD